MPYRDDTEALRDRVAHLERENAELRARLDKAEAAKSEAIELMSHACRAAVRNPVAAGALVAGIASTVAALIPRKG